MLGALSKLDRGILTAAALGLVADMTLTKALAQPKALDPPRVAPHIFEVLLENDRVRVLKVTERHGETQPLHARRDRVVVYLTPCAWVITDETGETRMDGYKFGEVEWRDAVTLGGQTSNVIDACLSVEIELKSSAP